MNISVHQDHWNQIKNILCRTDGYTSKKYGFSYQSPVTSVWNCVAYQHPKIHRAVRLFLNVGTRLKPLLQNRCWYCQSTRIFVHHQIGQLICSDCGEVLDDCAVQGCSFQQSVGLQPFASNSKPILPRKLSRNMSKRLNHFKYWLNRIQGKEHCHITSMEMNELTNELRKRPHIPISAESIRFALNRIGKPQYFNNTYNILKRITGEALVQFESHHESCLIQFFIQIQDCFCEVAGKRANMVSYLYLIRKMSELLGWSDISPHIPLLKSKFKTRELDKIWYKICQHHRLNFITSV